MSEGSIGRRELVQAGETAANIKQIIKKNSKECSMRKCDFLMTKNAVVNVKGTVNMFEVICFLSFSPKTVPLFSHNALIMTLLCF